MDAASHSWDRPAPHCDAGRSQVFGLLPEELASLGVPGRAVHAFSMLQRPWLWRDGLPFLRKDALAFLRETTDMALPAVAERRSSEDGSVKFALRLHDGHLVEAVHMPRDVRSPRATFCISSQVGCAMGCGFCATGAMGILRNLSAGEIVAQVLVLLRECGPERSQSVTLVFMGMGEPLHNLDEVHRAVTIFNHPQGLNISTRRITVSTSGLAPGIERLAALRPRPWLALSLNATTDELRSKLMPVNRAFPLARLRQALSTWNPEPREKLTFEYVLLSGINDSLEDADRLADWLGEWRAGHNLNLIRYNEHPGSPFKEPSDLPLAAFVARLKAAGCFVTVRKSRGRDVQGACGQLAR